MPCAWWSRCVGGRTRARASGVRAKPQGKAELTANASLYCWSPALHRSHNTTSLTSHAAASWPRTAWAASASGPLKGARRRCTQRASAAALSGRGGGAASHGAPTLLRPSPVSAPALCGRRPGSWSVVRDSAKEMARWSDRSSDIDRFRCQHSAPTLCGSSIVQHRRRCHAVIFLGSNQLASQWFNNSFLFRNLCVCARESRIERRGLIKRPTKQAA